MSALPPPVPARASGQPPPVPMRTVAKGNSGFAKMAASICLVAPLFVCGLAYLEHVMSPRIPINRQAIVSLAIGGVSCLLVLIGLIMGIVALVTMKAGSRTPIVCQSLAGIAIIGLLAAIAVPNFVRGRTTALARGKNYNDLAAARKDFTAAAVDSLKGNGKATAGLDHFNQALDRVIKNSSDDDAVILKAERAYTEHITELQKNYQESADGIKAANVLSVSNLFDRTEIHTRRALVEQFLKRNNELEAFLSHDEASFRQELTQAKAPAPQIESAVEGFRKGKRPGASVIIFEIRDQDDRMGHAMLDFLDLLDDNWGQWSYNEQTGHVRFENTKVLSRYNDLLHEINQAGVDQAAAQKKLASVVEQASAK